MDGRPNEQVLTVAPLGGRDLARAGWLKGFALRYGRKVRAVKTAADLNPTTIPAAARALAADVLELLKVDDLEILIIAHSQGCQVVGQWLDLFARALTPTQAARIRCVLTGNLERAFYGYGARKPRWWPAGNIARTTPNDTLIEVLDIGRRKDLWANYPGGIPSMIRLTLFNPDHLNYTMIDPDELNPLQQKTVGNTRYVNVA